MVQKRNTSLVVDQLQGDPLINLQRMFLEEYLLCIIYTFQNKIPIYYVRLAIFLLGGTKKLAGQW